MRCRSIAIMLLVAVCFSASSWAQGSHFFTDVTESVGLTDVGNNKAAWADFNNDGWVDLYCGGTLWRNEGGIFGWMMISLVVGDGIWGDYDNDGYLDFFSYTHHRLYHNIGGFAFEERSDLLPELPMTVTLGAVWGDFNNDGYLDLYVGGYEEPYQPDALLINEDGASFTLTWQESDDIDPGRGVTAADFDEDGNLDVYVSNYRLEANWLWHNDGLGNFTNIAHTYGAAGDYDGWSYSYGHTIGSAWGDLDDDGHLDLFVGNFSHPEEWQDRPKFLRNTGPIGSEQSWHFEDKSAGAGLGWQESFASPALADFDNDGDLDLYLTTVYPGDTCVLYRNQGDWTFSNESYLLPGTIGNTYQAAWADYDNDGDLDLLSGGKLLRNEFGQYNNWVKVALIGANELNDGSQTAVGAQVRIPLGTRRLLRQVETATGEGNGNEQTLHFGLGDYSDPVQVNVTWPDGSISVVETEINRMVIIEMDDSAVAVDQQVGEPVPRFVRVYPNPFNPQASIEYELPEQTTVILRIFDLAGRLVDVLVEGEEMAAGTHAATWTGRDAQGRTLPSGTYFYRLETDGFVETRRMTLIR